LRAQGATEYLVLLAVVLIVALVSVALLGFFPGMASDAQMTQSQMYWQGASPIAIRETSALAFTAVYTMPYLFLENTGAYPIRITKILGNGQEISQIYDPVGIVDMSSYYYMAPGEKKYIAYAAPFFPSLPSSRGILLAVGSSGSGGRILVASSSNCAYNSSSAGMLFVNNFGFEYIEYIDGQQITKRQIGKPLIIKCSG